LLRYFILKWFQFAAIVNGITLVFIPHAPYFYPKICIL
jgi:hypothetical protein